MKTYRLYIMILVSAGIHLGAFGLWIQSSQNIHVTTDMRSQNLNVTLTQPQTPVIEPKKLVKKPKMVNKPVHEQVAVKSETKTSRPNPKNAKNRIPKKTNSTEPSIPAQQAIKPPEQKTALLNNDMLKALQSEFRARFKYPMLARKRGWQGKVVLALNINTQGKIANIAIKRSSGFKILDRNAVKTFKAIDMITPSLHERIKQSHSFNIPIIYQLNGG